MDKKNIDFDKIIRNINQIQDMAYINTIRSNIFNIFKYDIVFYDNYGIDIIIQKKR